MPSPIASAPHSATPQPSVEHGRVLADVLCPPLENGHDGGRQEELLPAGDPGDRGQVLPDAGGHREGGRGRWGRPGPLPPGGPLPRQGLRAVVAEGGGHGASQLCTPAPAYPESTLTCPLASGSTLAVAPHKLWALPRPVSWESWAPPPTPRPQLGPETVLSLFLPLLPA